MDIHHYKSRTLTHIPHASEHFFDILFSFCRVSNNFRIVPLNVCSDVGSEMSSDYMPSHICYIHTVSLKNDFSDVV